MTLGQRICVLDQGRVEQVGPPLEVYRRPATRFVAAFIGSPAMNLIEGRIETGTFRRGALRVPADGLAPGPVVLGLRPNEVAAEPGGELEVREVEELGAHSSLAVELEGQRLWITREGPPAARAGERVTLRVPRGAAHWFDAASGRRLPEADA
jgi:ABC-type sugar transport system ATPase subunit